MKTFFSALAFAVIAAFSASAQNLPLAHKVTLGEQKIKGNGAIDVTVLGDPAPEIKLEVVLTRSFNGDIAETMDREQVEMSHGEN